MTRTPQNPDFERLVRESFEKQQVMRTFGASLTRVAPGEVDIELPYRADLTQQHGFLHAGVVTTVLDSACGYAAFSVMPPDVAVLTVEYKINLLRPAQGERMVARARVVRAGKTLTVCAGDVFAVAGGAEKVVATMLATVASVPERDGLRQ